MSFVSVSNTRFLNNNLLTGTIPTQLNMGPNYYGILELSSNNFCPVADYSTWATSNDYSSITQPCQVALTLPSPVSAPRASPVSTAKLVCFFLLFQPKILLLFIFCP